jgi:hypothetical protein
LSFTDRELEVLQAAEDPFLCVPIQDPYYGPSGGHVCIGENGGIRRVRPARRVCLSPLALITANRINLEAFDLLPHPPSQSLRCWWKWLEGRHIRRFLEAGGAEKVRISRKLSRADVDGLRDWGVMGGCRRKPSRVHPLFKVAKGSEARLIMDCRSVNKALPKPGEMGLPTIHEVFDAMVQREWLIQADGRSYFYQFRLDEDAQDLFGACVVPIRGKKRWLRMSVLPMGYSFAPGIAQQTSLALIGNVRLQDGEYGTAWVDNFLFATQTRERAVEVVKSLQEVSNTVGLELKPDILVARSMVVLGAVVDAENKRITPTPEMLAAVHEAREEWALRSTPRTLFRLAGSAIWVLYAIARHPLCMHEAAIQHMSEIAKTTFGDTTAWDRSYIRTEMQTKAMDRLVAAAKQASWEHKPRKGTSAWSWSDASNVGLGLVLDKGPGDEEEWFMMAKLDASVFVNELLGAIGGILHADRSGKIATHWVDNSAACRAIIRGISSSRAGNLLLRKLCETEIEDDHTLGWVRTSIQRADALSRGEWEAERYVGPWPGREEHRRWRAPGKKGGGEIYRMGS